MRSAASSAHSKGRAFILPTPHVLLATGGIGGLYEATTNPVGNFGQGIALAARAGADLADMEFVQFHPTALRSKPQAAGARQRGGARRGRGRSSTNAASASWRDQPAAELAPRDVVARAISAEIARGGRVFLDAREALGDRFPMRFPLIDRLCREAGIDPARQLIPVRPAVHYHMGGVATDENGRSSVPGLWVAGEAASTGLHGANRLASNSLLEAAVMGMRAARDIAGTAVCLRPTAIEPLPPQPDASPVRTIVSGHLGVLRNGGTIHGAIGALLPLVEKRGTGNRPCHRRPADRRLCGTADGIARRPCPHRFPAQACAGQTPQDEPSSGAEFCASCRIRSHCQECLT